MSRRGVGYGGFRRNIRGSVASAGGGGGGGGTPLTWWSALTEEEIPFAGFTEATAPVITNETVLETSLSNLNTTCQNNPGRIIRVTSGGGGNAFLLDIADVEIRIPSGVVPALIFFGFSFPDNGTVDRVRLVGEAADSKVNQIDFDAAGGVNDVVIDSLLVNDGIDLQDQLLGPVVLRKVVGSKIEGGGGSSFALAGPSDLLIADCNIGTVHNSASPGLNDWCLRLTGTGRHVYVDSQFQAQSLQPVIRRASSCSVYKKRVTTVHYDQVSATNGECFADVGTGATETYNAGFYIEDSVSYLGGSGGHRVGGVNAGAGADQSHLWRITDHGWHTVSGNSSPVTDAALATLEANEPAAGEWEYRLGSPTYDTAWDGVPPAWPDRVGAISGVAMDAGNGDSDPYDLNP